MKTERLKILHVVFSLEPGGLENGLVNVARRLDPEEFEIHVCCLERGGVFIERLPDPANVTILHKPPGLSPVTVYQLAKVISTIKPDVIHSHNLGPLIYSSLANGLSARRPLLQGEHGIPLGQRGTKFMQERRCFYNFCKKVQAVSHSLRDELIENGLPADKITVILNGVDAQRFLPVPHAEAREKIKLPQAGPVIGIVGRFRRAKRHLDMIDAFNRVAAQNPTAQLLVVGDEGEVCDDVKAKVAASPVAGRIHLVGFQKDPQNYYPAMDLLVSASLSEGLSNVILEAMACGVPVLAHTATCGNAELVIDGETGRIADLSTVESLEQNLKSILANPEKLAQMGAATRAHVTKHFAMEPMVERYAQLYREVAGKDGSS